VTVTRRPGAARTAAGGDGQVPARELVLVVDDDDQMLRLVKRVLERAGFECVTVDNGEVAHESAVDWRPDIILLDLMLGSTTGDQILADIRKDFRTRLIPVVFLTVRSSLKDKVEHLLAGADDYVTKPFIAEELVARLRAVISRSTNTRDLNPLTGMSGNTDILREINLRLKANERFAVLYPDIDTFKSYNDHYGFLRGDDVIKTLGTIILEPGLAESVAAEITKRFDEAIPDLYDEVDRVRGWIEYEDRSGSALKTGLVSVSIGIVVAEPGSYESAAALASRAAEVKGVAKRMPGSRWVVDRRRPPEARGGRTR